MSARPGPTAPFTYLRSRSRAARIACIYVVLSLLWIWASGWLVQHLASNPGWQVRLEDLKGTAFVLLTGGLLYVALKQSFHRLEASRTSLVAANRQLAALAAFPQLCPIPILEFDEDGLIVYENDAARAQSEPDGPAAILPPDVDAVLSGCLASGEPILALDAERGGAHWRWWFFPNDERNRTYAFGRERTPEAELDTQITRAAAMESVGRMAAGIAHDFNNVLTAIGGYSELLERELAGDPGHAEDAHAIAAEVHRARGLIRQLMLLGRSQPQAPAELDMNQHLLQIERLVRHLVPRNVELRFALCDGPVPIQFDPQELEQAVMNLISNAGDAMPKGGVVTVSTEIRAPARAVLRVTDTGTGIAPNDLPHIFEPFFTTKPAGQGTGLGLASAYGIVKRNGGEIDVETVAGSGSTFLMWLPLTRPVRSNQGTAANQQNSTQRSRGGPVDGDTGERAG